MIKQTLGDIVRLIKEAVKVKTLYYCSVVNLCDKQTLGDVVRLAKETVKDYIKVM